MSLVETKFLKEIKFNQETSTVNACGMEFEIEFKHYDKNESYWDKAYYLKTNHFKVVITQHGLISVKRALFEFLRCICDCRLYLGTYESSTPAEWYRKYYQLSYVDAGEIIRQLTMDEFAINKMGFDGGIVSRFLPFKTIANVPKETFSGLTEKEIDEKLGKMNDVIKIRRYFYDKLELDYLAAKKSSKFVLKKEPDPNDIVIRDENDDTPEVANLRGLAIECGMMVGTEKDREATTLVKLEKLLCMHPSSKETFEESCKHIVDAFKTLEPSYFSIPEINRQTKDGYLDSTSNRTNDKLRVLRMKHRTMIDFIGEWFDKYMKSINVAERNLCMEIINTTSSSYMSAFKRKAPYKIGSEIPRIINNNNAEPFERYVKTQTINMLSYNERKKLGLIKEK